MMRTLSFTQPDFIITVLPPASMETQILGQEGRPELLPLCQSLGECEGCPPSASNGAEPSSSSEVLIYVASIFLNALISFSSPLWTWNDFLERRDD